ncbi:hypothetical protein NY2A_B199R [Paramecium bursaria Chlorella virus NY2A]|uniref:Uncharacterized protein B199R n=1 Tax=Paramecium bursaria Chlorella virus NY2A TaxID=46021 RepID=A7IW74_PBCVN|nr:hypothetical protein NY2A_B199R [Paramecium bursaria Chlorella virus NY2A]ABT14598.1 hypothetical protein NY2A_B199R [Paramecium bursaria Chlorella virus NY2A]
MRIYIMSYKTVQRYLHNSLKLQTFNKYEISKETRIVRHKKTKKEVSFSYTTDKYLRACLQDDSGKQRPVYLHVLLMSTFGPPKTVAKHTVDHFDKNRKNNVLTNLRWLDESGQKSNRDMPETYKTAFIIVKDGIEKTAKEWAASERVTEDTMYCRARENQKGFAYKDYENLEDEEWKDVSARNKISNFGRYALHSGDARKVMFAHELRTNGRYPMVGNIGLHVTVFKTFYPETFEEYPNLKVLHLDDDPMNPVLSNLYLGTDSDNRKDAHDNGCYDGTPRERIPCFGIHKKSGDRTEKFESIHDAETWLRKNVNKKATFVNISGCFTNPEKHKSAYGYVWYKL